MNDNRGWFRRRGWAGAAAILGVGRSRHRHRARPEIFLLEDRRSMAAFVVTDASDSQSRSLHFTPDHYTRPGPRSDRPANGRVPHGTVMSV
jgi:hypothetical protein